MNFYEVKGGVWGGVKLAVIVTHFVLFSKKKTSNFLLEGANHQKLNNKKSIYHINNEAILFSCMYSVRD